MPKQKMVKVVVDKWTDDPVCKKCYRQEADDESAYESFHAIHLEDTDILFMTCKICGYNWLMETADAK